MKVDNIALSKTACGSYLDSIASAKKSVYAKQTAQTVTANTDTADIDETASMKNDLRQSFKTLLDQLKDTCPDIQFFISPGDKTSEKDIIAEAVSKMGNGYLIFLSQDFMDSLYAGEESYQRLTQALIEAAKHLNSYGSGTMVLLGADKAVYASKKPEATQKPPFFNITSSNSTTNWNAGMVSSPAQQMVRKSGLLSSNPFHTSGAYARLAHAKSKTAVQSVMQETRRNISTLKILSVFGSDKERLKAKKALRALQKLLLRGQTKLRSFDDEKLTDIRRKRAQEQEQREKELQAQRELKRRQLTRKLRDGAIRKEGQLEILEIPGLRKHYLGREKLRALYGVPPVSSPPPTPGLGVTGMSFEGVSFGGEAIPADMQVAEVVSF